jgi:hypothetical protein
MGILFKRSLEGSGEPFFGCACCGTHLALYKHLRSTNFRGRTGTGFLFDKVVNITTGPSEDSVMTTGMHTIRIIYCIDCHENLGWRYEVAFEEDQKYKEGKFILEEALINKQADVDASADDDLGSPRPM